MQVLFYAPEYRPNLSNMIRTAEFYGLKQVYIYDENYLLSPPNNKVSRAEMNHLARVWTAGALDHIEVLSIENVQEFLKTYQGRKIATMIDENAKNLKNFKFEQNDLLIMGSEKEGLPVEIANLCDESIYIQQIGHTNCLNVSVCFGILLNKMINNL